MKRIKFVKNLVLAGLGLPLLAACGNDIQPETKTAAPATGASLAAANPTSTPANSGLATPPSAIPAATPVPTASPAPVTTTTGPVPTNEPVVIHFSEFYADNTAVGALEPSEKLKAADGKLVQITGYMAPPLKPALDFFVLTRIKLVVCPFCSASTDWPQDIVLITLGKGKTIEQMEDPLTIIGKLEVGDAVDPQTGFFSLLRLRATSIDVFKGS